MLIVILCPRRHQERSVEGEASRSGAGGHSVAQQGFLGVARPLHRKRHPTQQQSGSVEEAERALQGFVAAYLPLLVALFQDEDGSTALLFRLVVKPRLRQE